MGDSDIATTAHEYENNHYWTECTFRALYVRSIKSSKEGMVVLEKKLSENTILPHKIVKNMAKDWHKNLPDKITAKDRKEPYVYKDFAWSYKPLNYYREPISKEVDYTLDD